MEFRTIASVRPSRWTVGLPLERIWETSKLFGIDPTLVMAIVKVESSGVPWAFNFEPGWHYHTRVKEFAGKSGVDQDSERMAQATSWGLMQIMGTVAREMGFDGPLTALCNPDKGLYYGVKKLTQLLEAYPHESDAVSAYNAGSPIRDKTGNYRNERYVLKVYGYLNEFRDFPYKSRA